MADGGRGAVDPGHGGGAAPPNCTCHAAPMRWKKDSRWASGGHWSCVVLARERDRRYDDNNPGRRQARTARLRDAGLCVCCGQDVAITETLCFVCLGKKDEWNLTGRL